MNKRIPYIIIIVALFLVSFVITLNIQKDKASISQPVILSINQTTKLLELGAIKVHTDVEFSDGDKPLNIVARTIKGDCHIYQDILGRYYCRWENGKD